MRQNAHIYVLAKDGGPVKIGHATNIERRAREQGNGRDGVRLVYTSPCLDAAERVERLAHKLLCLNVVRIGRTEWFRATVDDAVAAIERAIRVVSGEEDMPDLSGLLPAEGVKRKERTIPVRLSDELIGQIDAICADRALAGVSRSQVIRELLVKALKSEKVARK